jgi:hypothetical protein
VESLEPLPSRTTLPALLAELRAPGVMKADVDALLRGLALPLVSGETPRERADFLLSLIESSDVNDMQGTDGRTVRAAAVRALLDLGYPYALEIPPEALGDVPGARGGQGAQELPVAGLVATFTGLMVQLFKGLPVTLELLSSEKSTANVYGLIFLTALLGPALSATLGGWKRMRWLQRLGLLTMALTGALWLAPFIALWASHKPSLDLGDIFTYLTAGLGFLLGAYLTRRPEWLAEEALPDTRELPAQETSSQLGRGSENSKDAIE